MSISTTIRNQTKAQARRVEWRTNEYTRLNTRSNTFGYSWKLNECLLIGRANNTHKIETQNSSYEIRKAKKKITERYKLFLSTLIYLFIFFLLLLLLLLLFTCCCSYRKKVLWVQRNENAVVVVFGQLSGKNWIPKQTKTENRKKNTKKIQKKYIQKSVNAFNQMESFCQPCDLVSWAVYEWERCVGGSEGIFAWRNTYPMHSGHNADSYRPRGRSPC